MILLISCSLVFLDVYFALSSLVFLSSINTFLSYLVCLTSTSETALIGSVNPGCGTDKCPSLILALCVHITQKVVSLLS